MHSTRGSRMEKSRNIWYPSQSCLGLSILGVLFFSSLTAKELFNTSDSRFVSGTVDYNEVKKISFSFFGAADIDGKVIMHSISNELNMPIIETNGIEGEALSANIDVNILSRKSDDNSWLVTIDAYIFGTSDKIKRNAGALYKGVMPIMSHILVFTEVKHSKDIEQAISSHLQDFLNKISNSGGMKPKLFLID